MLLVSVPFCMALSFKCPEIRFLSYHTVYLDECFMCSWKEYGFSYCWVECSILFKCSVAILAVNLIVLSTTKRRILKFPAVIGDVYLSFQFRQFLLYVFYTLLLSACTLRIVLTSWELVFLSLWNVIMDPPLVICPVLKPTLSDINMATTYYLLF